MRYKAIFDKQICHAMAFRGGVFCLVLRRLAGGPAQVLSYFLHVAAIFGVQKCAKEVWRSAKGDQWATSGKEKLTFAKPSGTVARDRQKIGQ